MPKNKIDSFPAMRVLLQFLLDAVNKQAAEIEKLKQQIADS